MSEYQQKEYPQKDNAGALFTNQKKATDTDPNYKGEVLIGGNSFWVNGWVNTSQAGNKYMKLSFTPKSKLLHLKLNLSLPSSTRIRIFRSDRPLRSAPP